MNEMLTPQEAALYLGQTARFFLKDDEAELLLPVTGKQIVGLAEGRYSEFKLLLRPLSDLHKAEALEMGLFKERVEWHDPTYATWLKYIWKMYDNGDLEMKPLEQKSFIEKGFDLYHLIESGKAIDKTLTPTP